VDVDGIDAGALRRLRLEKGINLTTLASLPDTSVRGASIRRFP
jgi:hypothetical protein